MEYHQCISKKEELYYKIHKFFGDSSEEDLQKLIDYIKNAKYNDIYFLNDPNEFKTILHILNRISSSHHRYPNFITKIKQIISFISEYIKKYFESSELFKIFRNNKIILQFLFEHKILNVKSNFSYANVPSILFKRC